MKKRAKAKNREKVNKREIIKKTHKTILLYLVIVLLIILAVWVYLFYFYKFDTFRVCVTNDIKETAFPCTAKEQCIDYILSTNPNLKLTILNSPVFAQEKITQVLNEAISCDSTCKVREFYGSGIKFGDRPQGKACQKGETEIKEVIRGKEALALMKYSK
jgi:hypothetical protein